MNPVVVVLGDLLGPDGDRATFLLLLRLVLLGDSGLIPFHPLRIFLDFCNNFD